MRLTLLELVAELRKCADDDVEFAQQIAPACIVIIDRNKTGATPSDMIRAFFQIT